MDNEAKKDKKFFDFLVSLGVNPTISFVQKTTGLTWMECEEIMSNANYSRYSYFAYDIRELEYILQNLTEERAKILFEILNSTDEEYFEGELQWKYNATERHITKRGNKYLRKVIFEVCLSYIQHKPEGDPVYEFIEKKRSEGKCGKEALVAGINKLLYIYYGKVTQPYRELEI